LKELDAKGVMEAAGVMSAQLLLPNLPLPPTSALACCSVRRRWRWQGNALGSQGQGLENRLIPGTS
jgi:hypothetical protein